MYDIEKVIAFKNCIGCGACAVASPDDYAIDMSFDGRFEARVVSPMIAKDASSVCPLSGSTSNETQIAEDLYPDLPRDDQIGRHLSTFATSVGTGTYRDLGGSGGLVSWLAAEMLERGLVDAVVHVKPSQSDGSDAMLFQYAISQTVKEVHEGAKSRYYPIEMSGVLKEIQASSKRYLVIGLPCFIKSIRLMQREGILSPESVPYCIGLVCGHLKSRYFADYIASQRGSAFQPLAGFNFRHKIEGRTAADYGFTYRAAEAPNVDRGPWPMADVRGKDWGEGQFKNEACEFCDDVLAECADIAIGDAWLPGYVADYRGTNIVITRHREVDAILREGATRGDLTSEPVSVADVVRSQASGLRHRREGLAHRLKRRKTSGTWAPEKRVKPVLAPSFSRRLIYDLRWKISVHSSRIYAEALAEGAPQSFEKRMARFILPYKAVLKMSGLTKRALDRLPRAFRAASVDRNLKR